MKSKLKGCRVERELLDRFHSIGFGCIRIAGSGVNKNAPDLIAGTQGKLFIIECKSSKKNYLYLDKEEAQNVINYASKFGGTGWYGLRFDRKEWRFIKAEEILKTNRIVPEEGLTFEELVQFLELKRK